MGREGARGPDETGGQSRLIVLGGGIGAGKSTVMERLVSAGFEPVVADVIGHALLADDASVLDAVADRWPTSVIEGTVDRAALGAIVFGDPAELEALEAILHPAIVAEIESRLAAATGDVVVEVPLLPLVRDHPVFAISGAVKVAVVADERTRLARAVARGGDAGDIRRRMAAQATDDEWRSWADVVIDNSGSWAATEHAIDDLIAEVRRA